MPGPNPDPMPRFYVAKHADGYNAFIRHDVSEHIRKELTALPVEMAYGDEERVRRILAQEAPCREASRYFTHTFPNNMTRDSYPKAVRLGQKHQALMHEYDSRFSALERRLVYAIIEDGKIVSTCQSSRENAVAGEAWLRTLPEYRGRGYAKQVTRMWAHELQMVGKIPFYSLKLGNEPSRALAESLKLRLCFAVVDYD